MTASYVFRPMIAADLPLIGRWLRQAHVREWWGDPDEQLARACVDLAKDWRTDRYLRRLEAMLIVADKDEIYTVTGTGDVLEPESGVAAIGSGGNFALAAARALLDTDKDAETIVRRSLDIAADICVYTNRNVTVEALSAG